mgnify:CR=1 FL=1
MGCICQNAEMGPSQELETFHLDLVALYDNINPELTLTALE